MYLQDLLYQSFQVLRELKESVYTYFLKVNK